MHFKEKISEVGRKDSKQGQVVLVFHILLLVATTKIVDMKDRHREMVLRYFIDGGGNICDRLVVVPGVAGVILTLCGGRGSPRFAPPQRAGQRAHGVKVFLPHHRGWVHRASSHVTVH